VKKSYLFFLILITAQNLLAKELSSFVQQFEATGFVNDYAGLISENERTQLEQKIIAINDTTSIQFAVISLQSLEEHSAKAVAEGVANFWGVGQKELNNGILILASVRERAIHIALGEGVDDYIDDEYIKTLIKKVIKPAFQKGQYALGINNAIEKIYMQLRGTDLDRQVIQKKQNLYWIVGVFSFILILLILFWFIRKG